MEKTLDNEYVEFLEENYEKEGWIGLTEADIEDDMLKIKTLEADKKRRKDFRDMQVAKYDLFLQGKIEAADKEIEYRKQRIAYFLEEKRKEDPNYKLSTMEGSAYFRTTKSWKYDEEKVLQSLKDTGHEELIKIKETIDKAAIKKKLSMSGKHAVTQDGEVIEGIEIEEKTDLTLRLN